MLNCVAKLCTYVMSINGGAIDRYSLKRQNTRSFEQPNSVEN